MSKMLNEFYSIQCRPRSTLWTVTTLVYLCRGKQRRPCAKYRSLTTNFHYLLSLHLHLFTELLTPLSNQRSSLEISALVQFLHPSIFLFLFFVIISSCIIPHGTKLAEHGLFYFTSIFSLALTFLCPILRFIKHLEFVLAPFDSI